MPISSSLRQFYGAAWKKTRAAILERDRNRCVMCGKPDRQKVITITGKRQDGSNFMLWRNAARVWINSKGWPASLDELIQLAEAVAFHRRSVLVILTVGHLNHKSGDDRPENLRSMCQWCHLNYDREHHRQTRCARKDQTRPLLHDSLPEQ